MSTFIPDPLHPAIVHFPIVLTVLLPLFALGALWAIRRGASPMRAWGLTSAVAGALVASAWLAVQTGEGQGEKVESVVPENALESHEEAGEAFLYFAGGVLVVTLVGLARGRVGQVARLAGTAGALGLVVAGWQVGHSGGELVYRHGAASAYTQPGAVGGGAAGAARPVAERGADRD